ncbi:hypothetical protein CEXT_675351 [Caerostris extrusa]|uniref:Secreted protein n=1 Tax=Caerostris extrusa TaxID=172846 RepID=A0AAV4U9T0_CAEEX|nr:hypothetical protein CEXT_675351 [Caerostris extrusa]
MPASLQCVRLARATQARLVSLSSLTSTALFIFSSRPPKEEDKTRGPLRIKNVVPHSGLRSAVNYLTRSVNQKSRAFTCHTPRLLYRCRHFGLRKILYHTAVYTY